MNRQEDLTKVFDKTWTANHNDVAKRSREKEIKFINRMFNVKEEPETVTKSITPGMQVDRLNKNINNTTNFQRKSQINSIIKKWK